MSTLPQPCAHPTLMLCGHAPGRCTRPPTHVPQQRDRLCRAHPCMLAPFIPATLQKPNRHRSSRCSQAQPGVVGRAPGPCGCSSTRCSMSYAPAVPGAISRGSIRRGKRRTRHGASGACMACGNASTRRCAAPSACKQATTLIPRRPSWTARV